MKPENASCLIDLKYCAKWNSHELPAATTGWSAHTLLKEQKTLHWCCIILREYIISQYGGSYKCNSTTRGPVNTIEIYLPVAMALRHW